MGQSHPKPGDCSDIFSCQIAESKREVLNNATGDDYNEPFCALQFLLALCLCLSLVNMFMLCHLALKAGNACKALPLRHLIDCRNYYVDVEKGDFVNDIGFEEDRLKNDHTKQSAARALLYDALVKDNHTVHASSEKSALASTLDFDGSQCKDVPTN